MPKENTHLYFASLALSGLADAPGADVAARRSGAFLWGSVAPDALYYGLAARVRNAAASIHGDDGASPAGVAMALLRDARDSRDEAARAFCLGYVSHMLLDTVFHPVVNALVQAGEGTLDGKRAVYAHRALETTLDARLNPDCRAGGMLDPGELPGLRSLAVLARETGLARKAVVRTFRLFRRANILFADGRAYKTVDLVHRLPGLDLSTLLALFYAHAPPAHACFPKGLACWEEGRETALTPGDLVERALALCGPAFASAGEYFQGKLADWEMEAALPRGPLCRGLMSHCLAS